MGMELAYLKDGNTDLDNSPVGAANVRFAPNEMFAATADLKYLMEKGDLKIKKITWQ